LYLKKNTPSLSSSQSVSSISGKDDTLHNDNNISILHNTPTLNKTQSKNN